MISVQSRVLLQARPLGIKALALVLLLVAMLVASLLVAKPASAQGNLQSWGYNLSGQLGNGTNINSKQPVDVQGNLGALKSVEGGGHHTLAVKSDGTVWAWGTNDFGALGDGTTISSNTPVQVQGLTDVRDVAAGFGHSLALKSDGTVWAWGYNSNGQLGNGQSGTFSTTPVKVANLPGVKDIAAGEYYSVALKDNGTVWSWGYSSLFGSLGDGTTTDRKLPVPVKTANGDVLTGIQAISARSYTTLALKTSGSVLAWGDGTNGQLGNGTNNIVNPSPVKVSNLDGVKDIAAGAGYSMALKTDGTVRSWGANINGQLGNGNNIASNTPVQVIAPTGGGNLTGIKSISAAMGHALALGNDTRVLAWGGNLYGQLGDGTQTHKNKPVYVRTNLGGIQSGIQAVATGGWHSLMVKQ